MLLNRLFKKFDNLKVLILKMLLILVPAVIPTGVYILGPLAGSHKDNRPEIKSC